MFEVQHAARAARKTFTAGNTVTVLYRLALPGMPAHVYGDRAMERTNTALHTASFFGDNHGSSESPSSSSVWLKKFVELHCFYYSVIQFGSAKEIKIVLTSNFVQPR